MSRIAVAAVLVLTVGLGACGNGADPRTAKADLASAASTATSSSAAASTSPGTSDAPPPMASSLSEVQATISDPELGQTIFVDSYVRGFPFPAKAASLSQDYELVLVKVKLTAGTKYSGSVSSLDLRVLTDGSDIPNTAFTLANAEMATADYTPIPESGAEAGASVEGWVAFRIAKEAKELTLRYVRPEVKSPGGGNSIPRKEIDIPLTG